MSKLTDRIIYGVILFSLIFVALISLDIISMTAYYILMGILLIITVLCTIFKNHDANCTKDEEVKG